MFDKVLDKLFGRSKAPRTRSSSTASSGPVWAQPSAPAAAAAEQDGPMPKAKKEWLRESAREIDRGAPGEVLCELRDGMTRSELREHLATLYRRHNRAASSLDPKLREEANIMLDAIVEMRRKYLGE